MLFAAYNFMLCRTYFVKLRWNCLNRGFGATGFLMNWLAMAVLLSEVTALPGISRSTQDAALYFIRADFALIMLSAGAYKLFSGYFKGEGMEYALVNPMWSNLSGVYSRLSPKNKMFPFLNHNTWFWEVAAGFLMLIPMSMPTGSVLIALSFIFVAVHFRLNFLPGLIFTCCLFYLCPWTDKISASGGLAEFNVTVPVFIDKFLSVCIPAGLAVVVASHLCLWINFLRRGNGSSGIVNWFNRYANHAGIIIWRVFTADISNFIVNIYSESGAGHRKLLSEYGKALNLFGSRYSNTIESVTLACIFNTLKYQPSAVELLDKKIRMYSESVSGESSSKIVFQVSRIHKKKNFNAEVSAEFTFDRISKTVTHNIFKNEWFQPAESSLTKSTKQLGSYESE